jgi:hypothetical protein
MKKAFLIFLALFFVLELGAQTVEDFYKISLDKNRTGMYVLGGWAVSNILTGTYGWATQSGSNKYFYQMNTMWNVVNLSIAGVALYQFYNTDISLLGGEEMLRKHINFERLFLINAGLDIGYMAAGAWLINRSGKSEKNSLRYKGFGQAVILQGAFLFAFDLVMFALQYQHRLKFQPILESIAFKPGEISYIFQF